MTLEDRLDALTTALKETTAALTAIAGLASGGTTAPAAVATPAEEKPKTKTAAEKKAEKEAAAAAAAASGDDAVVSKEKTDEVLAWLGEFAKEEDKANPEGVHPEVTARREALKKAYTGLKVTKLGDVKGAAEVKRFEEWFEKAKAADKGFGIGRFAADPEPAADTGGDDDLSI